MIVIVVLSGIAAVTTAARAQSAADTTDSMLDIDASLELDHHSHHSAPFGRAGSRYWGLLSGAGFALENDDDSTDLNLAVTYHYFLARDVEVIGELGGWYFSQAGDNAGGINPGFTFRWHFVNRGAWTIYADAGAGLLFATDNVPDGGSSFNFMPRAGVGASLRVNEEGSRAYLGTRWHHISNARINGDSQNPDRDGVMIYAGLMFPF